MPEGRGTAFVKVLNSHPGKSPDAAIRDLEVMAGATNYRNWIFSHFKNFIGNRVVELGAGIGNYTEMLEDRELVIAVDNHPPAVELMKKAFSAHKNVIPVLRDISSPEVLDLAMHRPDSVICINVLEHVKDDEKALSYVYEILENGGKLLLLVPAFRFLYGNVDRTVGHHRRYGRKEIVRKLNKAGFGILDVFYMNAISVPVWFLNNRILKRKDESPSQVVFFDRFVVPWIMSVERAIRPPFGLSIVAICEKKAAAG